MLRRSASRASLTVLAIGFLACAGAGFAAADPDPPAPAFAVRGLDGKVIRSATLKGRPVVLDFWATWCAPCRASMPHLDAVHQRYRSNGLYVLGLSVDDSDPAAVRLFAQRLGVRFPIAMADEKMLDEYGPIRSIPTTFFISRDGKIVRRVVGYLDQETIEAYVRELF